MSPRLSGHHSVSSLRQPRSCSTLEEFTQAVLYQELGRSTPAKTHTSLTDRPLSWLVFKIVDIIKHRAMQHDAVLATGIITNAFVIISVLSAFPWVRKSVSHFQALLSPFLFTVAD